MPILATAGKAALVPFAGVAGGGVTKFAALVASMAVPCAVSSVAHALSGAALGLVLVRPGR